MALDETHIRVGGKWRNRWYAVDAQGSIAILHPTVQWDARAAKARGKSDRRAETPARTGNYLARHRTATGFAQR